MTVYAPIGGFDLIAASAAYHDKTVDNIGVYADIAALEAAAVAANLATEITRAEGAESTLTSAVSAEVTRAEGAESTLATAVGAEVTRAEAAESSIGTSIAGLNQSVYNILHG